MSTRIGLLDSFGGLVGSIIAAIVMLVFAILSFFVTVFIVQGGYSPSGDLAVLSAGSSRPARSSPGRRR